MARDLQFFQKSQRSLSLSCQVTQAPDVVWSDLFQAFQPICEQVWQPAGNDPFLLIKAAAFDA